MANGLISGLLGGVAGFGGAVSELSDERRKALADQLKRELDEQEKIAAEGRDVTNKKALLEHQNKLGISQSRKEELDLLNKAEETKYNRSRTDTISDMEKEQGYALERIQEQGKIQKSISDVNDEEKSYKLERARAYEQLPTALQKIVPGIKYDKESETITSERGMTPKEQQDVEAVARKYGFDISFTDEQEVDKAGWLTGSDVVRNIASVAYVGRSNKLTEADTGGTISAHMQKTSDSQGGIDRDVDTILGELEDTNPNKKLTEADAGGTTSTHTKNQTGKPYIKDGKEVYGLEAGAAPLPTTVEGWSALADKVGVGSENWKSLGRLAMQAGGLVWGAYKKAVDATGMFSVESQKKAMKESGYYK